MTRCVCMMDDIMLQVIKLSRECKNSYIHNKKREDENKKMIEERIEGIIIEDEDGYNNRDIDKKKMDPNAHEFKPNETQTTDTRQSSVTKGVESSTTTFTRKPMNPSAFEFTPTRHKD